MPENIRGIAAAAVVLVLIAVVTLALLPSPMECAQDSHRCAMAWIDHSERMLQSANPASAHYQAAVEALKKAKESMSIASARLKDIEEGMLPADLHNSLLVKTLCQEASRSARSAYQTIFRLPLKP